MPAVLDVEVHRPQPKLRIHPLATHIPIGLYPFAVFGAFALLLFSFVGPVFPVLAPLLERAPVVADATLVLLVLSVAFSVAIAGGDERQIRVHQRYWPS